MTLIAIIVALLVERITGHLPEWTTPRVLRNYHGILRALLPWEGLWRGALAIPVVLVPPMLITMWLQDAMREPVPEVLLSTIVLILCLGPRDLAEDVRRWLDARAEGDHQTALRIGHLLMQGPGRTHDTDVASSRRLLGALFIQSHERLFGVLLWFLLLGPVGAVFYRIVSRLPRLFLERDASPAAEAADTIHALSAWAPARVTAVLFGLAGSLDDAIGEYQQLAQQTVLGWRNYTWAILAEVASGSIEFENKDGGTEVPATLELAAREVLGLQFRALMILLALVAIFTSGLFFA